MKKIKDFIVRYFVEFAVIFNIFGVIWFVNIKEGSIDELVIKFFVLTIMGTLILLLIFVPRRLFRRSRLRRIIYIKIIRKYPEVFFIAYWIFRKQAEVIIYFGQQYLGYFVWRSLKYVLVGTKVKGLKPYRGFGDVGEIIMLIFYEFYLGIIYIILLVLCKIEEMLYFFDTKPLKTIIKSGIVGYSLTMITLLLGGSSLLKYLIVLFFIFVYLNRFIYIVYGYYVNKREQVDSEMKIEKNDKKRGLKNSFMMNGFNEFPIKSKYDDANKINCKRYSEIPRAFHLKRLNGCSRLMRKYNLEYVPNGLLSRGERDKRTGRRLDLSNKEDMSFFLRYPELREPDYDFEFLKVHAERRKYSDIEHGILTNNVEHGTKTLLQKITDYDRFRLNLVRTYIEDYYQEPDNIYGMFFNVKMEKPCLISSYADLKWMSEKYFELKDLKPFLFRFYEIIEDDRLRNEFLEASKSCFYYYGRTKESTEEYLESLSEEEYIEMRENQLKLLERFGL